MNTSETKWTFRFSPSQRFLCLTSVSRLVAYRCKLFFPLFFLPLPVYSFCLLHCFLFLTNRMEYMDDCTIPEHGYLILHDHARVVKLFCGQNGNTSVDTFSVIIPHAWFPNSRLCIESSYSVSPSRCWGVKYRSVYKSTPKGSCGENKEQGRLVTTFCWDWCSAVENKNVLTTSLTSKFYDTAK